MALRRKVQTEEESIVHSIAFDALLLMIKAERRRLLEIFYQQGLDHLLVELKL